MGLDVIFIAGTPSGQNWNEVYVCLQDGCGRNYHPQFGYFQLLDDRKLSSATQQRRECPDHAGWTQYLSQNQAGHTVWQCTQNHPPAGTAQKT